MYIKQEYNWFSLDIFKLSSNYSVFILIYVYIRFTWIFMCLVQFHVEKHPITI